MSDNTQKKRETWKNNLLGDYYYKRFDHFGNARHERVQAGRTFLLTEEERQYNEQSSAEGFNPFRNGTFSAVNLVETAEDYEDIVANPNVRSEKEIVELLDLNATELKKELALIDSELILKLLKSAIDDEESDYSAAKIRAVNDRYKEVVPEIKANPSLNSNDIPKENKRLK